MSQPWYSYKCRFEALCDFGLLMCNLEDEGVRFVKNEIKQWSGEFDWDFESNYELEDLKELMMRISEEKEGDLHVMYQSLNYRALYTGERTYI